jgi:hypothetical protein
MLRGARLIKMENDKNENPKTSYGAGFQPAIWTNSEPQREMVKINGE